MEFLGAATRFLSVFIIGLEGFDESWNVRDFPDGFLEDVLNIFGIETIFLGLGQQSDELFSH